MHLRSIGSDNTKHKPLVLIVDDDCDNLLFASCAIELMGIDCVAVNESRKCLNFARELLPDIILLDIVMPEMSGMEIANIIKQDKHLSHIPLVAVTGLTKEKDREKLAAIGFDAYLCKPYLIEDLEAKLSVLLNNL